MSYGDYLPNAKYPGIIILLTLEIDILDKSKTLNSKSNQFVEDYLFHLWSKTFNEDQIKPIFTRIANHVIFI
jgi:hypothetical protein